MIEDKLEKTKAKNSQEEESVSDDSCSLDLNSKNLWRAKDSGISNGRESVKTVQPNHPAKSREKAHERK